MPGPTTEQQITEVLTGLLAPYGCISCGAVIGPAGSWTQGDARMVPLPDGSLLHMTHDEREAPVVVNSRGEKDETILVSLTDENNCALCVWAQMRKGSLVAGLGVDLAATLDFAGERGAMFNHLLFTPREQELAAKLEPDDLPLGLAYAFSAKEASFKALAAPLRSWYRTHTEELLFDVRCFELADLTHEAGTARKGEAQRAMHQLGIASIELARMSLGDQALTLAAALRI